MVKLEIQQIGLIKMVHLPAANSYSYNLLWTQHCEAIEEDINGKKISRPQVYPVRLWNIIQIETNASWDKMT